MKKIILLVLSIGMCFAFASCAELVEPIQSGNSSSTEMESTSDGLENSSDNETQYVTVTITNFLASSSFMIRSESMRLNLAFP